MYERPHHNPDLESIISDKITENQNLIDDLSTSVTHENQSALFNIFYDLKGYYQTFIKPTIDFAASLPQSLIDFLGDPIYTKDVLGKNGKRLMIKKLRTMKKGSDCEYHSLIQMNGLDEYGKIKDDPRITAFGKILRATYADEWLQLAQVFKGNLRLIGSRPRNDEELVPYGQELREYIERYGPGFIPSTMGLIHKPNSFEAKKESELNYYRNIESGPVPQFLMDIKYATIAVINVFFRGEKSN